MINQLIEVYRRALESGEKAAVVAAVFSLQGEYYNLLVERRLGEAKRLRRFLIEERIMV